MKREEISISNLTPLQYIESVGNAWINTGFTPNQDTRVVCEFMITQLPPEWAGGGRDENVVSIPFGSRYDFMTRSFTAYVPANWANARIISYGNNGQLVAERTFTNTQWQGMTNCYFAISHFTNSMYGYYKHFSCYEELTDAEVAQLYQRGGVPE